MKSFGVNVNVVRKGVGGGNVIKGKRNKITKTISIMK